MTLLIFLGQPRIIVREFPRYMPINPASRVLVTSSLLPDNTPVRIDIRNLSRQHLFRVEVDPKNPPTVVRSPGSPGSSVSSGSPAATNTPTSAGSPSSSDHPGSTPESPSHPSTPASHATPDQVQEVYLDWDQAIDDRGYLRHCPVCSCKELYTRKNVPQITGFVIVSLAVVVSLILLGTQHTRAAVAVFMFMGALDLAILLLARRKLVCYRCRSEYHGLPISKDQHLWDSATAEKYPR